MQAVPAAGEVSRRVFLRAGSFSLMGLSVAEQAALGSWRPQHQQRRCVWINLTGGPSQLETFDPKPTASTEIRGPFRAIETSVPGLQLSETLPLLARQAQHFSLVRSLYSHAAPLHEAGWQLMGTGRLNGRNQNFPHWSAVVSRYAPSPKKTPANVIFPGPLVSSYPAVSTGQGAGWLDEKFAPRAWDSTPNLPFDEVASRAYGNHAFGRRLHAARAALDSGARCVTVNLFDRLDQGVTFDCHGATGAGVGVGTIFDYRDFLCPALDRALATLIGDLARTGELDETLVVVSGEFGRTPHINVDHGRDHWTRCWSALLAGGPFVGGQILGRSDATASEPVDQPITPTDLVATVIAWFGIDARLLPGSSNVDDAASVPLMSFAQPLGDLLPAEAAA